MRKSRTWQPCLGALPMGDLNAVDNAQVAHVNVVRSSRGLRDENMLRYRAPLPRGPVYDGIVVDDRVVVTKVPRRVDRRTPDDVADVIEQAQPVYEAAGLKAKESKRVRQASVAEPWGAHFDGREGTARAKDESVQRTVAFTMALLSLGVSTASVWEAAIGL